MFIEFTYIYGLKVLNWSSACLWNFPTILNNTINFHTKWKFINAPIFIKRCLKNYIWIPPRPKVRWKLILKRRKMLRRRWRKINLFLCRDGCHAWRMEGGILGKPGCKLKTLISRRDLNLYRAIHLDYESGGTFYRCRVIEMNLGAVMFCSIF